MHEGGGSRGRRRHSERLLVEGGRHQPLLVHASLGDALHEQRQPQGRRLRAPVARRHLKVGARPERRIRWTDEGSEPSAGRRRGEQCAR